MTATKHEKIRVLIADDHPVVRSGVKNALRQQKNVEVVGEARSGRQAVSLAVRTQPDVVLMDISMPVMSGSEAARRIRKRLPSVKVLAFTMHDSREYIQDIVLAGASGYVLKNTSTMELVRAIEKVYRGETFFSRRALEVLATQYAKEIARRGKRAASDLTARENEVLRLVAQGRSNKEIAKGLDVSIRTVETHRERIMRKLDVHDIAGLTRYAMARGLLNVK